MVSELYELDGYIFYHVERDYIAPNIIYRCEKEGAKPKILRVAFRTNRSKDDYLGEVEYIRYLHENGGSVANMIGSRNGNLVEEIAHENHMFFICMFEKAKGKQLAENGYQYREGALVSEYYYNCGKTLGKLHQLSKEYTPVHKRHSFFDHFNAEYIDKLIPDSLFVLKSKLCKLIEELDGLSKDIEAYGMIHFDFSDGNYNIDFDTGQITVYDFDNSCFGWYLYDLANLWVHGVGWVQFEPNPTKRKLFMDDYFNTIIEGYRSETNISDSTLAHLSLLIQAVLMENIADEYESAKSNGEEVDYDDEELLYLIKCLEDDIPYKGFFSEIYSCDSPFEYKDARELFHTRYKFHEYN